MLRRFAIFALALVVVGILWLARRGERASSPTPAALEPTAAASRAADALVEPSADGVTATAEPVERRSPVDTPSASQRGSCEIRGRFLLPTGEPAATVPMYFISRSGAGGAPELRELASEVDGTFSIRFQPDENPNLWGKLPGYALFQWEWFEVEAGEAIDVGDFVLERGGTILVRIVDEVGQPLADGWTVYAEAGRDYPDGRDDDSQVIVEHAGVDGAFRAEEVPTGRVELKARSELAGWIDGPTVQVRDGEIVEAEIRYGGPRRIIVSICVERFPQTGRDPEVELTSEDGELEVEEWGVERYPQRQVFYDLRSGAYRVEINDPRFLPWSQEGVLPGADVVARLRGSSVLEVHVFDEDEREEIHTYGAILRFRNVDFVPTEFDLFADGAGPPADGVIEGIVPGDFTLIISAPGFAHEQVEIEDLVPRERRAVVVRLDRGGG